MGYTNDPKLIGIALAGTIVLVISSLAFTKAGDIKYAVKGSIPNPISRRRTTTSGGSGTRRRRSKGYSRKNS
jgi:hypothetical protein